MMKRRKHTVPNLNMASMPDLIFTVLFFFMIASHMRNSSPLVGLQTPTGTQLTQPDRKSALVYLYVGRDSKQVQVGNHMVGLKGIRQAIQEERQKLSSEDRRQMIVCLKADRQTPMWLISDVKQALREASATRIIYAAKDNKLTGKNEK